MIKIERSLFVEGGYVIKFGNNAIWPLHISELKSLRDEINRVLNIPEEK